MNYVSLKVEYTTNLNMIAPDSKNFIRFPTKYLSTLSDTKIQTSHGVINLTQPYTGH